MLEEVGAILPVDALDLHEAQKRLVDERRRRHAAVASRAGQARAGMRFNSCSTSGIR
jgi:hypothetical protein